MVLINSNRVMERQETINMLRTAGLHVGLPLVLALLSFYFFHPGVFSFDSFAQYNQATTGKFTNDHPVILACLMRILIPFFGPGGLLFVYQIFYWLGWSFLVFALRGKFKYIALGFLPFFYLLSLTIWKDTAVMIGLIWTVAFFVFFLETKNFLYLICSIFCCLLVSLFRVNATIFTIPLFFTEIIIVCLFYKKTNKPILVTGVFTLIYMCSCNLAQNKLDEFVHSKDISMLPSLMLWDVAGINYSINNFEEELPNFIFVNDKNKASNWVRNYRDNANTICWDQGFFCGIPREKNNEMFGYWLNKIIEHPFSYIKGRYEFAKILYGVKKDKYFFPNSYVYFPYQTLRDNNAKGGIFRMSKLGEKVYNKLLVVADFFIKIKLYNFITFFGLSIILISFIFHLLRKGANDKYLIYALGLIISSWFNCLSLVILAPAADYRYVIPSVLFIIVSASVLFLRRKGFEYPKNNIT